MSTTLQDRNSDVALEGTGRRIEHARRDRLEGSLKAGPQRRRERLLRLGRFGIGLSQRPKDVSDHDLGEPTQDGLGVGHHLDERSRVRGRDGRVREQGLREVAGQRARHGDDGVLGRLLRERSKHGRRNFGRELVRRRERGEEGVQSRAVVGRGGLALADRRVDLLRDRQQRRFVSGCVESRKEADDCGAGRRRGRFCRRKDGGRETLLQGDVSLDDLGHCREEAFEDDERRFGETVQSLFKGGQVGQSHHLGGDGGAEKVGEGRDDLPRRDRLGRHNRGQVVVPDDVLQLVNVALADVLLALGVAQAEGNVDSQTDERRVAECWVRFRRRQGPDEARDSFVALWED